jgi:mRNA interferase HigB
VHVISKKPFKEAADRYPNERTAILDAYSVLNRGAFTNPHELRQIFPSLDNFKYKKKWWVIDIGGNNLRLIAAVQFVHQRIYVKHIVSHSEYDKLCEQYRKGVK